MNSLLQRQKSAEACRKRSTHGHWRNGRATLTYRSFQNAKARCNNPRHDKYPLYGGAGVEFRFSSFQEFLAELGERVEGMTLDRYPIQNGHYEPGNVRWATTSEQNSNRRHYRWKKNRGEDVRSTNSSVLS